MKKIYIVLPANFKSGGPELGHQLSALYAEKKDAQTIIAYTNVKEGESPIHPEFKKYVSDWERYENIIDDKDSIIIYPETLVNRLSDYKYAKKVIWWMSVDFYLQNAKVKYYFLSIRRNSKNPYKIFRCLLSTFKRIANGRFTAFRKSIYWADLHLYQSEYARLFLLDCGFNNIMPLSDYINDMYFNNVNKSLEKKDRKDNVLYNPRKGWTFTKKLIQREPTLNWIPIENMTTSDVVDLLRSSKLYIDFGNHPGKDRFPREAAISGCCIITGKYGAAKNKIDIEIPDSYKFENSDENIPYIISLIKDCLINYDDRVIDFSNYRKKIEREKSQFIVEANEVFDAILKL